VSEYAVHRGRNFLVMGSNVLFGCEYFKMSLDDFIHYDSVGEYIVYVRVEQSNSRALCLFELLMLRRGVLRVPGCDISARDCKTAISYLCNGWYYIWPLSHVCVSVFFALLIACFIFCTSSTIS